MEKSDAQFSDKRAEQGEPLTTKKESWELLSSNLEAEGEQRVEISLKIRFEQTLKNALDEC